MIDSLLAVMVLTVLAAAALAMYLLPVLVGWVRHVPDIGSVAVINILLGWTLAGWAIALALALRSVSPASPAAQTLPPGRPWPAPLPPGPVPPAGWPGWPGARAPRHDPPPLLLPPRPPGPWDRADSRDRQDFRDRQDPWDSEGPWAAGDPWAGGSRGPAGPGDTTERE